MRRSLSIRAALILAISLTGGAAAYAVTGVDDIIPPYGNQKGDVRKVDVYGGKLTIEGTSYSYDAKSVTFRNMNNGVIGAQALQPGMRVGYSTQTNAKTGKQEISEIWILKAGATK